MRRKNDLTPEFMEEVERVRGRFDQNARTAKRKSIYTVIASLMPPLRREYCPLGDPGSRAGSSSAQPASGSPQWDAD